ncbi:MAG: hypothetical protein AB1846_10705 [Chloroflexota bacterium]
MNASTVFYLCPTCFHASGAPDPGHEHPLLRVDPGPPGDDRRKPATDGSGRMLSAAPRWFIEAVTRSRTNPGLA